MTSPKIKIDYARVGNANPCYIVRLNGQMAVMTNKAQEIEDLAEVLGVTKKYLNRLCKEARN